MAKDVGPLEQVIEDHTQPLLAGALGLGLSPVDAEELVQETFVAFLEAVKRFEGRSSVRTYLFGILYRKAKERFRKAKRELPADPADETWKDRFDTRGHWVTPPKGPEAAALNAETGALIAGCLETLPEAQRAAFTLREVDKKSTEEICNILDVSTTNLGVLLFRARNKLRDCVSARWDEKA